MKAMLIMLLSLWVQVPPAVQASSDDYVIGPRDVISVKIFNDENLSRPALTVDAEGTVDCPHIGRVTVKGLTVRQVEDVLVKRYSGDWLVNPSITVTVKEFRNRIVYVRGEVTNPGAVELDADPTLEAALTRAGSMSNNAGSYILVTRAPRSEGEKPDQQRISREDLDTGRAGTVRLRAGDTVFVPKADTFYIDGQVKAPNEYVLREGLTVLQALALAGGATDRAAKNRIKIVRIVNGKKEERTVKETEIVRPGDTVFVPARRF
jgi:polysaccharide export outer membrane protein